MSGFAVEGEGSDQVLVPGSHANINHAGLPGVPAAEAFTAGVHAGTDHSAIAGVGEDNPVQVSPAERTAGVEGTLRSFSPFDIAAMAAIHGETDAVTDSVTLTPGAGVDISRTIPGGTLSIDNESLTFELFGRETGSGADTVTVTFGGSTIMTLPIANNSEAFYIRGTIIRTGATTQLIYVDGLQVDAGAVPVVTRTVGAETLASPITLTAADASNNVTFDALLVRKWAA